MWRYLSLDASFADLFLSTAGAVTAANVLDAEAQAQKSPE